MTRTEDISDLFTKEGIQKLKQGQLLRFNLEGSITELIITSLNKKSGKVLARHATTYDPKDTTITDKKGNKIAFNTGEVIRL